MYCGFEMTPPDWALQESRADGWYTIRTDIPQEEVVDLRKANKDDGKNEDTDFRFIPAPVKPHKTPKPKDNK